MLQCDRVDVLIEEQRDVDHQEHDGQTLGTNAVWQDLCSVADE